MFSSAFHFDHVVSEEEANFRLWRKQDGFCLGTQLYSFPLFGCYPSPLGKLFLCLYLDVCISNPFFYLSSLFVNWKGTNDSFEKNIGNGKWMSSPCIFDFLQCFKCMISFLLFGVNNTVHYTPSICEPGNFSLLCQIDPINLWGFALCDEDVFSFLDSCFDLKYCILTKFKTPNIHSCMIWLFMSVILNLHHGKTTWLLPHCT